MKAEFIINRQGKDMVLYAGLLDAAHAVGLVSIRTTLLMQPSEANGNTTIVGAEASFADGRVFTGIGDANEKSVGRMIAVHAIRMAETRAKARALRDALNIGAVSLEELGGDDEPAEKPRYRGKGAKQDAEDERKLAALSRYQQLVNKMLANEITPTALNTDEASVQDIEAYIVSETGRARSVMAERRDAAS